MRRREFVMIVGGAATAWPLMTHAQQLDQVRRVGVLTNRAESDPEGQAHLRAFVQRLSELGWVEGRNLRLDIRWGAGSDERYRRYAAELVALSPDVILAATSPVVAALQKATRTVALVFAGVIDPVGSGFVESLSQPGGNTTGFTVFDFAIGGKWLGLLKEIAPDVTRAAVLRDPTIAAGVGLFGAIQAVAPIGVELSVIGLQDANVVERGIASFARRANGGLVVTASPFGSTHPDVIVVLAARYKLPAVYPFRYFVDVGGLISYGPNIAALYRPTAEYVDRILKGEKPADLPVQAPTKYELVINLKAAKALGIEIPHSVLARADDVIE